MQVEVKIEDKEVKEALKKAAERIGDLTPVMRTIGEVVRTSIERNFIASGRPKWKPSGRVKKKGGQTLSDSGVLRRSFSVNEAIIRATRNSVSVGTNVKYAAIHQLGGRTRAHDIRPKNKKALRTPFGLFRKVRHPGSVIPARPFLMVQDEDWTEIEHTINDYIMGR